MNKTIDRLERELNYIDDNIYNLNKAIQEHEEEKIIIKKEIEDLKSKKTKNVIFINRSTWNGVEYLIECYSVDVVTGEKIEQLKFIKITQKEKTSMIDVLKEISESYNTKDIITEEKLVKKIKEEFNVINNSN